VHISFNSLEKFMGPFKLTDLLVTHTGDSRYLHLQMRALLGRCRRRWGKKVLRSFDFRLNTLHCIVGNVEAHVNKTLADGTEFFQVCQLLRRRGDSCGGVGGRLRWGGPREGGGD
jgi:hypothetical protein